MNRDYSLFVNGRIDFTAASCHYPVGFFVISMLFDLVGVWTALPGPGMAGSNSLAAGSANDTRSHTHKRDSLFARDVIQAP